MYRIDLNSDLGESFGRYTLGLDDQIIPLVSSANIACGQHAGDPVVMRKTVGMAKDAGIAIGAHPGYPDLQGFGRRDMHLSPDEAYVDPKLVLVGLANSALVDEGRKLGLVTAEEFFADRNYTDEGRLVSRNDPAALIRDEEHAIERVKNAIREGAVMSVTGKLVDLHPDTLCVHGDSPSALAFVSRIRQELEQDDIAIKAVGAE